MRQIIDTLAQLQRLRDKSVKDMTVQLAKQQQVCIGFDNNIKALGYLIQKTGTGVEAPSVGFAGESERPGFTQKRGVSGRRCRR